MQGDRILAPYHGFVVPNSFSLLWHNLIIFHVYAEIYLPKFSSRSCNVIKSYHWVVVRRSWDVSWKHFSPLCVPMHACISIISVQRMLLYYYFCDFLFLYLFTVDINPKVVHVQYSSGYQQTGIPNPKKDILEAPVANGGPRLHWLRCSFAWNQPKKAPFCFWGFEAPMVIIPVWAYIILNNLKIFWWGLRGHSCLGFGMSQCRGENPGWFLIETGLKTKWSSMAGSPHNMPATMHSKLYFNYNERM